MDGSTVLRWFTGVSLDANNMNYNVNWTSPFLKNVLSCLNETLIGSNRVEIYNSLSLLNLLSHAEPYGALLVIITLCIVGQIYLKKKNPGEKKKLTLRWPEFINPRVVFGIISFLVFIIILPIIFLVLFVSYLNKKVVHFILKKKHGSFFVKLLDGSDTVWALEEDNAKSIINVIASIEVDCGEWDNINENVLLKCLKETVAYKLLSSDPIYSKMIYKRSFEFGYFFWEKNQDWCINDFIRSMVIPTENDYITYDDLTSFVANNVNTSLPYNNRASWEIMVSDKPMKRNDSKYCVNEDSSIYPVLFRIHHSLGDGVVLLKLLLKTIADEKINASIYLEHASPTLKLKNSIASWFEVFDFENIRNIVLKKIYDMIKNVIVLFLVPASLMRQVLRPPDINVLHGPTLTGKKVVAWVSDDICEESLLKKIKRMKKRVPGATFSDLFLTALSASHHKYFTQHKISRQKSLPECITSVVPVRMDSTEMNITTQSTDMPFKLENKFSVGLLSIPIKNIDSKDGKKLSLLQRLVEVRRQTSELRHSADFQVNYWLMSIAGDVLPEAILRPMLCSEQATLVVSNLPGPSDVTICGGHKLHDMAFFVPHRGTTGIGVTLLTCNGRVQLGLMADSALISSSKDAQSILTGTVEELNNLDSYTSRRMQSQRNSLEIHASQ